MSLKPPGDMSLKLPEGYREVRRPPAVGDLIVPADGSSYLGRIKSVSKEGDSVIHECEKTGVLYEKSYFGFFCRYCIIEPEKPWLPNLLNPFRAAMGQSWGKR